MTWGNMGCNGGNQGLAFRYTGTYPIVPAIDYPYVSDSTLTKGTCSYNANKAVTGATTYTYVNANNVQALKTALAKQPIASTVEADTAIFKNYSSGIINSTACGTSLDHSVLIVGWGTSEG